MCTNKQGELCQAKRPLEGNIPNTDKDGYPIVTRLQDTDNESYF